MNTFIKGERLNVGGEEQYIGQLRKRSEGIKHRDEREKAGREERDRKTAVQMDTGERTGIGREGKTNCENKLRQSDSGEMGKERFSSLLVLKHCSPQFLSNSLLCSLIAYVHCPISHIELPLRKIVLKNFTVF